MDSISGYSKSFVEHGLIIGLVNIRADITYSQGLPKKFSRETRYDYYMPVFANLGEQAVLNKEIWFQNATLALDNGVFGYQEAWADLRYFPSQITGKLRVDAAQTLAAWHLSQDFASLPALNSQFITQDMPLDRVVAVESDEDIIFDSYINLKHARELPVYSIPGVTRF